MVGPGDTYLIYLKATKKEHLFVALSDPALDEESVLLVNFTTLRATSEKACVIKKGEHPFVNHDTCVSYRDATVASVQQLEQFVRDGLSKPHDPVSPELLKRIREGAMASAELKLDWADILIKQELVD